MCFEEGIFPNVGCITPAKLAAHAAESCRRATTARRGRVASSPLPHPPVSCSMPLGPSLSLTEEGFPGLSGVVLPPVEASSGSSFVVPPGLMLGLGLAQRLSAVEALVKIRV